MWDEETKTYWIPVRQALYGLHDADGLFPNVRLRDVKTAFPTRKTLRSRTRFRTVFVPEADVIALKRRFEVAPVLKNLSSPLAVDKSAADSDLTALLIAACVVF